VIWRSDTLDRPSADGSILVRSRKQPTQLHPGRQVLGALSTLNPLVRRLRRPASGARQSGADTRLRANRRLGLRCPRETRADAARAVHPGRFWCVHPSTASGELFDGNSSSVRWKSNCIRKTLRILNDALAAASHVPQKSKLELPVQHTPFPISLAMSSQGNHWWPTSVPAYGQVGHHWWPTKVPTL
jgi:hypothetical protein